MGNLPVQPVSDAVRSIVGKTIVGIDRVFFDYPGEGTDESDGDMEIHFADGSLVALSGGSDSELLDVSDEAWKDPVAGDLSAADLESLFRYGKPTRHCYSARPPYSGFIGETVTAVEILQNEVMTWGPSGVAIETSRGTFWFIVECDESHLYWAAPPDKRILERIEAAR